ncbi:MAG: hypothetical protein RBU37_02225 [Myxococcota bacterium]|jgi:hypothetical protein|nr:hypothetical protein [Myxococcota bacterium]
MNLGEEAKRPTDKRLHPFLLQILGAMLQAALLFTPACERAELSPPRQLARLQALAVLHRTQSIAQNWLSREDSACPRPLTLESSRALGRHRRLLRSALVERELLLFEELDLRVDAERFSLQQSLFEPQSMRTATLTQLCTTERCAVGSNALPLMIAGESTQAVLSSVRHTLSSRDRLLSELNWQMAKGGALSSPSSTPAQVLRCPAMGAAGLSLWDGFELESASLIHHRDHLGRDRSLSLQLQLRPISEAERLFELRLDERVFYPGDDDFAPPLRAVPIDVLETETVSDLTALPLLDTVATESAVRSLLSRALLRRFPLPQSAASPH